MMWRYPRDSICLLAFPSFRMVEFSLSHFPFLVLGIAMFRGEAKRKKNAILMAIDGHWNMWKRIVKTMAWSSLRNSETTSNAAWKITKSGKPPSKTSRQKSKLVHQQTASFSWGLSQQCWGIKLCRLGIYLQTWMPRRVLKMTNVCEPGQS